MAFDSSSRLALTWAPIRDSLWFAPAVAALSGVVLAALATRIPTPSLGSPFLEAWIFSGGTDGARAVLSTIAGSLITVTGVVFSVTIVALQLASSQFTPRVVGSFVADRVNQVVLGVFIGTFTYTLLVLRTIQSEGENRETFVPYVAVTLAIVLLLVSVGALIVFINHAARSIQASTILHRETQRTLERIDALFPEQLGQPAARADEDDAEHADVPAEPPATVLAADAGYLQAVHAESLWRAGAGRRLTIRMELRIGAFAFPGRALVSVWPASECDERVLHAVHEAFVLGPQRTPEHDIELGLVEISDIGVRALSPGINDPTTAMHCIDRLAQVLAALATRAHPDVVRASQDRLVRLIVRDTPFDRAAGLAFDQIRHYGASAPTILKKLLESLHDLAVALPADARPALAAQAEAVLRTARRAVEDAMELADIERLAASARTAALTGRAGPARE